jgi:hypothetical protein
VRGFGAVNKDWAGEINTLLDRLHAFTLVAEIPDEEEKWKADAETPDWVIARMVAERVEEQADQGNLEPMRQAILRMFGRDWSRFLRRPPRQKSGRPPITENPISKAVDDYRNIMAHYEGKTDRPKGVTVEKIIADRYGIDQRQVRDRLKK